jgi:hypothetical protein
VKHYYLSAPALLCILYSSSILFGQSRIDTLIADGKACVDCFDYICAKDKYVNAHKSGMSKDSLCYFIAELYIHKGNFDTALVYNFACKSEVLPLKNLAQQQRKRIIDTLNIAQKYHPGSTPPDPAKTSSLSQGIHFLGTQTILSYNTYKSNTYIPLNENDGDLIFSYDDPIAATGLFDKYIRETNNGKYTYTLDLSLTGVFSLLNDPPLERRFQNLTIQSSASIINRQSGLRLSNSVSYSNDFSESRYFNVSPIIGLPFKFRNTLMAFNLPSRLLFDKKFHLIDGKAGFNLIASKAGNGIFRYGATIDLNYNWRPEKKLLSIKVGYTDSLVTNGTFNFYLDKDCTKKFNNDDGVGSYWFDSVPEISWIKMPEQKVNATLGLNSMIFWSKFWNLGFTFFIDGKIFTQKTSWYTIDTLSNLRDGQSGLFVLLYEKKSGKFYDHVPVGTSNNNGEPKLIKEFKLNEKKRFDGTVSAQMVLQRFGSHYGNFTVMLWGSQTFSTLHHYRIPIPVPKYSWGITGDYKPIHYVRKPNNRLTLN